MEIGYAALVRVIQRIFEVSEDQLPQLRARLKHLQHLRLPESANVGRKARAVYDADAVAQTALAFALIDTGLPPARAATLVRRGWSEARTAIGRGWHVAGKGKASAKESPIFIGVVNEGLQDMGRAPDEAPSGQLGVFTNAAVRKWFTLRDRQLLSASLVHAPTLACQLMDAIAIVQPDRAQALSAAFARMADDRGAVAASARTSARD